MSEFESPQGESPQGENPYAKAARMLLWLIALGMILIGVLIAGLEALKFLDHRPGHATPNTLKIALNALLILAGLVLLLVSGKLADKFARRLDE